MSRYAVGAIVLVVLVTVALLLWVYVAGESSTDAIALVLLPLYALGAILLIVVLDTAIRRLRRGGSVSDPRRT